jgi:hypothetical protein
MNELVKRDAIARHRARRAVLNNLSAELYPGDAHGFIGPIKPPSVQLGHGQDGRWNTEMLTATYYAWGRHDAGERRDANEIYDFGHAWADAQWAFRHRYRAGLVSLQRAYELFFDGVSF